MYKKQLHYIWTSYIRPVKIWYLLAVLLLLIVVAVFALRANNLRMVELRQAVYAADEKGENVEQALQELRAYVYAHMNTDLSSGANGVYPPIQLKFTYQRLQEAERQKAQAQNSDVYTQAQAYCESQNSTDFSGRNRVPCIERYVSEHGGAKPRVVPDAMYKFDFVSPSWSPDVAGFSVLLAVIAGVALVLRIVAGYAAKRFLD
ncbi:MAG TPA: hypothetical protein VF733_03205 [Candidatus Saccharimonadales bacterium]